MPGLVRMSFGLFNTEAEVDQAVALLSEFATHGLRGSYQLDKGSGEYRAEGCVTEIPADLGF